MVQSGLMKELFPVFSCVGTKSLLARRNSQAQEPWPYLALFLRRASKEELQSSLQLLKLSVKEQRAIERSWDLWQNPDKILNLNLGKQLQKASRRRCFLGVTNSRKRNRRTMDFKFEK